MNNYQPTDNCLTNKTILITGAGDGIGKAAALNFASLGATVILLGRTQSKLEKVYDAIEASGGAKPAIIPADLSEVGAEQAIDIANSIEQEFGQLDGILHNASILGDMSSIENYKPDVWQAVMQVNVNAAFFLTKFLFPQLRVAPHASVIFTTSGVGNQGKAYWGAYSVSKFATEGMAQVLADELENSNIRVNLINPGATQTAMRATAFPGEDPSKLKTADSLMPLYTYLMSDDSIGITGHRLDSDAQIPISVRSK